MTFGIDIAYPIVKQFGMGGYFLIFNIGYNFGALFKVR
jgi:hypothetical protein